MGTAQHFGAFYIDSPLLCIAKYQFLPIRVVFSRKNRCLRHIHAAIDVNCLAGNVGGSIAHQKGNHTGNFLRLTQAL